MKKFLGALALVAVVSLVSGCSSGPKRLSRGWDNWVNQKYSENAWVARRAAAGRAARLPDRRPRHGRRRRVLEPVLLLGQGRVGQPRYRLPLRERDGTEKVEPAVWDTGAPTSEPAVARARRPGYRVSARTTPGRRGGFRAAALSVKISPPIRSGHPMTLTRFQSESTASGASAAAPKVHVVTFGCQMNKYDSMLVEGRFRRRGYETTATMDDADVVLFNTCSGARARRGAHVLVARRAEAREEGAARPRDRRHGLHGAAHRGADLRPRRPGRPGVRHAPAAAPAGARGGRAGTADGGCGRERRPGRQGRAHPRHGHGVRGRRRPLGRGVPRRARPAT